MMRSGKESKMENYTPQIGDIILEHSNKTGPKTVMFFMTAPTIWHHLYRKIRGTQEKVEYYHVAMILNNGFNGFTGLAEEIEQQAKVQIADWNSDRKQIIFRKIELSREDKQDLKQEALSDIGQGYDVVNCFGKFLTWLTGIKLFARYMEWPKKEICINRVAYWYKQIIKERFGVVAHSELTTFTLYKYLISSTQYKVVYINNGE